MNREYNDGKVSDQVTYFTGIEVEQTPAYNMNTLFVVGVQSAEEVKQIADQQYIRHIYLGANQSYTPDDGWDDMIKQLLKDDFLVTLDFPHMYWEHVLESGYGEYTNFIPQVSIKLPYIGTASYNTVIKIDDIGFEETNMGVWCHLLPDLLDTKKITRWHEYKQDKIIK